MLCSCYYVIFLIVFLQTDLSTATFVSRKLLSHHHHHHHDLPQSDQSPSHVRLRLPLITEHPEDVSVRRHEPTTLNCKADGVPPPTIEWFKDGEKIKNTGNRMMLPSGSLFFLHVIHHKDTGTYWCVAINSVGTATSNKAVLSLALPSKNPRITEGPTDVLVQKNKPASLTCKAEGSPPPVIEWYKDGEKVRITDNRIILPNGTLYFLTVQSGDNGKDRTAGASGGPRGKGAESDVGTYLCVAKNEAGRTKSQSALLSLAEPPSAPPSDVNLKVLDKTTALLSWSEPRTGIKVISGYSVLLRTLESPNAKDWNRESNITTDGRTHSLTLNGLSPAATYEVAVSAFNSEGNGPSSPSLILRTDPMGGLLSRRTSSGGSSGGQDRLSSFLGKGEGFLRDPLRQPWFIVIAALAVMFILSSGVLIFLMRQRSGMRGKKQHPVVQHISLSLPKNDLSGSSSGSGGLATGIGGTSLVRDALWIDRSWFGTTGAQPREDSGGSQQQQQSLLYPPHHHQPLSLPKSGKRGVGHPKLINTHWTTSRFSSSNGKQQQHQTTKRNHHHHLSQQDAEDLEDSYSIIESNDYAEVAESVGGGGLLSTFKNRSNRSENNRSSTPGPYATTNLINITTNAMYRPVDEDFADFHEITTATSHHAPDTTPPPPPPLSSRPLVNNGTHSTILHNGSLLSNDNKSSSSFQPISMNSNVAGAYFDPSLRRSTAAPSPSPYHKTRGCD